MSLMGHDSLIGGSGAAACGWKDYRNIEQKQLIPQDAQHLPIRFSLRTAVLLCHLGKLREREGAGQPAGRLAAFYSVLWKRRMAKNSAATPITSRGSICGHSTSTPTPLRKMLRTITRK